MTLAATAVATVRRNDEGDARQRAARIVLEHERPDDLATGAQRRAGGEAARPRCRRRRAGLLGRIGAMRRVERVRWRDLVSGVRLELELPLAPFAGEVGGDAGDAQVRAERLHGGPADCGWVCGGSRPGGEATQDRELGVDPALGRWRSVRGGALGEQSLDVAGAVAAVPAGVDPVRREPAGVGPGANGVRDGPRAGRPPGQR